MKRLRCISRTLLVLVLLLGLALGAGVVLLILCLSAYQQIYVIGALIGFIVSSIVALLLPFLAYLRARQVQFLESLDARFGGEVPFLEEGKFVLALKKAGSKQPIYALHLILPKGLNDLQKKEAYFALSEKMAGIYEGKALIGYNDEGDFLFANVSSEGTFLDLSQNLFEALCKETDLPPMTLLLGKSQKEQPYEEAILEAVEATMIDQYNRDNLTLVTYFKEENGTKGVDFAFEKDQGRLSYSLLPFGVNEEGQIPLALLSPSLYDAYRGELTQKDLYHALQLSSSRLGLDQDASEEALYVLTEKPEIQKLGLILGEEAALDPEYLPNLAKKGVDFGRLVFFLPSLSLHKKPLHAFAEKALALGAKMGVFEYGGEALEGLLKAKVEYATLKPELLRKNADPKFLENIVGALRGIHVSVLVYGGHLGRELSDLPAEASIRVPRQEEKVEEEEVAE